MMVRHDEVAPSRRVKTIIIQKNNQLVKKINLFSLIKIIEHFYLKKKVFKDGY